MGSGHLITSCIMRSAIGYLGWHGFCGENIAAASQPGRSQSPFVGFVCVCCRGRSRFQSSNLCCMRCDACRVAVAMNARRDGSPVCESSAHCRLATDRLALLPAVQRRRSRHLRELPCSFLAPLYPPPPPPPPFSLPEPQHLDPSLHAFGPSLALSCDVAAEVLH